MALVSSEMGPSRRGWRRFRRNRLAMAAMGLLLVFFVVSVGSWPVSSQQYTVQHLDMNRQGPGLAPFAPFGYDSLGRSLFWRCLYGGGISMTIGLAAAVIALGIGVLWGGLAGWYGGRVDAVMMRIVDILYGLPYILLIVLLKMAFEPILTEWFTGLLGGGGGRIANIVILFVAIGGFSWLSMARVIRGQVLSLREQPFIEAARATGLPTGRILRCHLLPNLVGPIIVYATLTVPQAILQESFLSFLGIGVQAPMPSLGSLAAEGVRAVNTVESFWWMVLFPCGLLGLVLLSLNYIGDGLRDAFDPRTRFEKQG